MKTHPSRVLMDLVPKIGVGATGGIIPPATIVSASFPMALNNSPSAAITWRVPLNLTPWHPPDFFEAAALAGRRTQAEWLVAEQQLLSSRQWPRDETQGKDYQVLGVFNTAKLPVLRDAAVLKTYNTEGFTFYELFGGGPERNRGRRADSPKCYLEGYIPLISEWGEQFATSAHQMHADSEQLFNVPRATLEYRYLASNVLRILKEISKTPLTLMLGAYANGNEPFLFNATHTGEVSARGLVGPFSITEMPSTWGTPNTLLYGGRWLGGVAEGDPRETKLLWNLRQDDPHLELLPFPPSTAEKVCDAIDMAVNKLSAWNVPRFKIPPEYGGGEKYVVVVGGPVATHRLKDEDVLLVAVPREFLDFVTYPVDPSGVSPGWYVPLVPQVTAYVMGSPGVFNFKPATNEEDGLTSYVKDFDRLSHEGWKDRNTYCSARAPRGQIIYSRSARIFPQTLPAVVPWFMNSQDTIRIVSVGAAGGVLKTRKASSGKAAKKSTETA